MNDRFKNPLLHYGFLAAIYGVGLATLMFHTVGHAIGQKPAIAASCSPTGVVRRVKVGDEGLDPALITANFCDQIVFINTGHQSHLLALGEHEHHDDYPGFTNKTIGAGQSLTVTLGKVGAYPLHDHLHPGGDSQISVK